MNTYSTSDVLFLTVRLTEFNILSFGYSTSSSFLGDSRMKNYYAVTAQFGHVGRGKYLPKKVAIIAENGEEAAEKVRWMPRVKHHRKYAIMEVKKISREEYLELKKQNENDPYFKATSDKEQKKLCPEIRKQAIKYSTNCSKHKKTDRAEKIKFKMKKNKLVYNDAIYCMRNYEITLAY